MYLAKKFTQYFIRPLIQKRITRASSYTFNDIHIFIPAGVFHPKYFFSTRYLLSEILKLPLNGKKFLELGAGNGLISLSAAKKGALVTATDISEKVISNLKSNAIANNCTITILKSDLFESIPNAYYEIIAINPPYYPKNPRNELEMAWYCGANFEYFTKLFPQLVSRINEENLVLMILSEDCDITQIKFIAAQSGLALTVFTKKKIKWELNYIFKIVQLIN